MRKSNRSGDGGLTRLDESKVRYENVLGRTSFDARSKPSDDVFKSELDRLAEEARRKQYDKQVDLAVALVDAPTGLESTAERAESPIQRLLREAIQLIQEKLFEEALGKLKELLQEVPGHHEATYYTAYCHVQLDRDEDALLALVPLRGARLENQLAIRVQALKDGIRARMSLPIMLEALLLMGTKQYDELIGRLTKVLKLDPECALYYFLLGGTYMTVEKLVKAQETVEQGLQACDARDRNVLVGLMEQIGSRRCAKEMEPARKLFKEGKYREARAALRRLDSAYRPLPLYVTFDGYLGRLEGGGLLGIFRGSKDVSEVIPPGSFKEVDALYFFLVGDEVREAKRLMPEGKFGKAEGILRGALKYCPRFAYANYLYSGCLYRWMGERMESGSPPDIDEVVSALERAKSHARAAQVDPEIAEHVGELGKAVQEALDLMQRLRAEVTARKEEARPVNALVEEFQSIMESAEGGVGSHQQLKALLNRMRALKGKIPGVQKQVRSPEGREAMKQLTEAVDRNLGQLEEVNGEAEVIGSAAGEFEAIMKSAEGGVRSPAHFQELFNRMNALKSRLPNVRNKVTTPQGKKTIDDLAQAVDRNLKQLESMKSQVRESEIVEKNVSKFNNMMESLKRSPIGNYDQLTAAQSFFRNLLKEVQADKVRCQSADAKEVLDNLQKAIMNVLSQLKG